MSSIGSPGAAQRRVVSRAQGNLAFMQSLDGGSVGPSCAYIPPTRFSSSTVPSEASVSEVRSEALSTAMDDQGEESLSSYFDHHRLRSRRRSNGGSLLNTERHRSHRPSQGARRASQRLSRGGRRRSRRGSTNMGAASLSHISYEYEDSFASYSDGSFYSCDSDCTSPSAETEASSGSLSCSETVPSCSITMLGENSRSAISGRAPKRVHVAGLVHRGSASFGSFFGPGGIDPYDGTSMKRSSTATTGKAPPPPPPAMNESASHHPASPDDTLDMTRTPYRVPVEGTAAPPLPRVSGENIERLERVGRGRFASVYRAIDHNTNMLFALKEVELAAAFDVDYNKQMERLMMEVNVIRGLSHPNVVEFFGAKQEAHCLWVFLELMTGGSLASKIRDSGRLSEEEARRYTSQLLDGLGYLHSRNIIHRDLKGDNLLLNEEGVLKVGDFGTSKELNVMQTTDSVLGTPYFMAPEVIQASEYSLPADVWSVGCCVLEMLTGAPPHIDCETQMNVMMSVIRDGVSKVVDRLGDGVSAAAKDFVRQATSMAPSERWTVEQLKQHKWITQAVPRAGKTEKAAGKATATPTGKPAAVKVWKAAPSEAEKGEGALPQSKKGGGGPASPHGKPPRSMRLDTNALSKSSAAEDAAAEGLLRPDSARSSAVFSYGDVSDEGGDQDVGGTTSSNISSKGESPSSGGEEAGRRKKDKAKSSTSTTTATPAPAASTSTEAGTGGLPSLSPALPRSPPTGRPPRGRYAGGPSGGCSPPSSSLGGRSPFVTPHPPQASRTSPGAASRRWPSGLGRTGAPSSSSSTPSNPRTETSNHSTPQHNNHASTPTTKGLSARSAPSPLNRPRKKTSLGNQSGKGTPNATPVLNKTKPVHTARLPTTTSSQNELNGPGKR